MKLPRILWLALFPLRLVVAVLYGLLILLRNALYTYRLLPSWRLPRVVISIGNLSMGGTGKTPFAFFLIEALREQGIKVGYLSRGYGRRSNTLQEVSLTKPEPALAFGDEPTQVKLRFPEVPVFVGANRYKAGLALLAKYPETQVLLLDDGFQHRKLARDADVLLIDLARPPWKDWLFPLGYLREPLKAYQRADLLILNHKRPPPKKTHLPIRDKVTAPFVYKPLDLWHPTKGTQPLSFLAHKPILLFCGIAAPASFREMVEEAGGHLTEIHIFPDHHNYTERDIWRLRRAYRKLQKRFQLPNLLLLTTEKDLARLYNSPLLYQLDELPLYAMRIQMEPLSPQALEKVRTLYKLLPAYGHARSV